jgi:hypothetical protein
VVELSVVELLVVELLVVELSVVELLVVELLVVESWVIESKIDLVIRIFDRLSAEEYHSCQLVEEEAVLQEPFEEFFREFRR